MNTTGYVPVERANSQKSMQALYAAGEQVRKGKSIKGRKKEEEIGKEET
eukprot:UN07331